MRRSALSLTVVPVLLLLITMVGCGGGSGSSTSSSAVASITVNPPSISMNRGDVLQLTATPLTSTGAAVTADVAYSSSNSNIISVSTTGALCAGAWDNNNVVCCPGTWQDSGKTVCSPANITGTSDITMKSQNVSLTVTGFVHEKVDIVKADPVASGCISMGETAQLTASSFSSDPAVCGAGNPVPCQLPPATIGQYLWQATDTSVVSIDSKPATNGIATGLIPGQTAFFASIAGNHSPSQTITTCPVSSINLTVQGSTAAPLALNKADTKTLQAVAVDSKGKTLDGSVKNSAGTVINLPPLLWTSTQPFAVTTAAQSTTATTSVATAAAPGTTMLVASCSPDTCNKNLPPVFSNPIIATVSGTAGGTVYAASTSSFSLVPIDVATNTAGTTITLPRLPNSMVVNSAGTKVLLGADSGGLMSVDTASSVVSTLGFFGKFIGVSPDGTKGFVYNATSNVVFNVDLATGNPASAITALGGVATSADSSPDSKIFFATVGSKLFSFNASQGQRTLTLPGTAQQVAVLGSGPAAYVSTTPVQARATCDPATVVDTQAAVAPTLVKSIPNGDGVVVVDSPELVVLNHVNVNGGCPITLTENRTAVNLQGGNFTGRQLLVTPDSNLAFVTNNTGNLLSYNLSNATVKAIQLGGSATQSFTAGATLDSKQVYVGAGDGTVHRIDTSTMTDAQQIAVGLKQTDGTTPAVPDLVVVRNK